MKKTEQPSGELQPTRIKADALVASYASLCEIAPTGHILLDQKGVIRQVTLCGARLLGAECPRLVNQRFSRLLDESDRRAFRMFLKKVFAGQTKEGCEVTLPKADHPSLFVRIEGTRSEEGQKCQAMLMDITERKVMENKTRRFFQEIMVAREEERKRVASELHHDVGSLAVGLTAHLDAIEKDLCSGKYEEALQCIKRTRKLVDESVVRLKVMAGELRPLELDALGLRAALRQYFTQVSKHGSPRIHFRETLGQRRIPSGVGTTLFRVAQEALLNAIKHGHAKQVDVDLALGKTAIQLTVRDDGNGFDPAENRAQATSHLGLRLMREMAVAAGGDFTIGSGPGKGTTVRVSLPLESEALETNTVTARAKATIFDVKRRRRPQKGDGL